MPKRRASDNFMADWSHLADISEGTEDAQLLHAALAIIHAQELYSDKALYWARDTVVRYALDDLR